MDKKIILVILGIVVMIFLIILISNKPTEKLPAEEPITEELSEEESEDIIVSDEDKEVEDAEEIEEKDKIISPINCGKAVLTDIENKKNVEDFLNHFTCIIEASEECKPAIITTTLNYNYLNMVRLTATAFSEIRGPEVNKCIFYMRVDDIDLWFSPFVPKKTVNEVETLANQLRGKDGICRPETADLTALLNKWREGNFSPEDFDDADCKGELFDQIALF